MCIGLSPMHAHACLTACWLYCQFDVPAFIGLCTPPPGPFPLPLSHPVPQPRSNPGQTPGFTGMRVAEEVISKAQPAGLKVGLAGRSEAKLKALAQQLPGGDRAAILAGVDTNQPETVQRMVQSCRLLLNCVGPYRCVPCMVGSMLCGW